MLLTETHHGEKFVQRVRELERAGNRFEYVEMATNGSWLIAYYSLPQPELFSATLPPAVATTPKSTPPK